MPRYERLARYEHTF